MISISTKFFKMTWLSVLPKETNKHLLVRNYGNGKTWNPESTRKCFYHEGVFQFLEMDDNYFSSVVAVVVISVCEHVNNFWESVLSSIWVLGMNSGDLACQKSIFTPWAI